MKIFIDSAQLSEIEQAYTFGIIDGVTTNPSLLKKAVESMKKDIPLDAYIKKILKVARGTPVSLEVTTTNYRSMVREGKTLFKKFNSVAKNVYIKIPVNPCLEEHCYLEMDGIQAIKTLTQQKIPVNCTLIFTPEQALMAAKAGASFVSPFLGRENDFIREKAHIKFNKQDYFPSEGVKKKGKQISDEGIVSGVDLIKKTVELFRKQKIKSEVLAASIRNQREFREIALAGAHIATIPFELLTKIIQHPKTIQGMKKFTKDVPKEYVKISGGRR